MHDWCEKNMTAHRLRVYVQHFSVFTAISVIYKIILTTSAVSSTNLGSILIFASCVVGTCSVLCGCFFSVNGRGPVILFFLIFVRAAFNIFCFSAL